MNKENDRILAVSSEAQDFSDSGRLDKFYKKRGADYWRMNFQVFV
jgi:hypothetical protein